MMVRQAQIKILKHAKTTPEVLLVYGMAKKLGPLK